MNGPISDRVERLEKQVRSMRFILIAVGIGLAFVTGLACVALLIPVRSRLTQHYSPVSSTEPKAAVAEEMMARRFLVVDKQDRIVGVFGIAPKESTPQMALVNENATIQLNFKGMPRPTCYYTRQGCAAGVISFASPELRPGVFVQSTKASASLTAARNGAVRVSAETGYSAMLDTNIAGAVLSLSDGRKWQKAVDKSLAESKQLQSKPVSNPFDIPTQD